MSAQHLFDYHNTAERFHRELKELALRATQETEATPAAQSPDQERIYSRKEAAAKLGVCETTLYLLTKNGAIQSKKVGARRVVYTHSDLMAALQSPAVAGDGHRQTKRKTYTKKA
jgi:predicted DNA-binding transcriptional regulator AlpA